MDIAVIGAGRIGGTTARLLAAAGHRVALANARGAASLAALVAGIDGDVHALDLPDALAFGDVVVLAVPFARALELDPAPLRGRVVVDTTNHLPDRDGRVAALDRGERTDGGLLQDHLGGARVVGALNTIYWEHLRDAGAPAGTPGRRAVPIAGDDPEARRVVARLLDDMGFDAVDAGRLEAGGRRMEVGVYDEGDDAAAIRRRLDARGPGGTSAAGEGTHG